MGCLSFELILTKPTHNTDSSSGIRTILFHLNDWPLNDPQAKDVRHFLTKLLRSKLSSLRTYHMGRLRKSKDANFQDEPLTFHARSFASNCAITVLKTNTFISEGHQLRNSKETASYLVIFDR